MHLVCEVKRISKIATAEENVASNFRWIQAQVEAERFATQPALGKWDFCLQTLLYSSYVRL